MSKNIVDYRIDKGKPVMRWVVVTKRPKLYVPAPLGSEYVAFACYDEKQVSHYWKRCLERHDFMRVRESNNLPRIGTDDTLTIYDA